MWEFDSIVCINLYERDDRMKECEEVFRKLKIPGKVRRFHRNTDGKRGCYESHLSVIKEAYENGCRNVLVFEDDFIPSPEYDEKYIKKAVEFMKQNDNWDIFYFGHQPDVFFSEAEVVEDNIMKCFSTLTHAYVLSRKFMKKIMNRPYDGTAIDKIFLKNENSYAIYPMQFYQNDSASDIAASAPIRGLRYSELYAYYINYPIFYFLAIFVTMLLIIIIFFIFKNYF